jgi:hypothetical protein
MRYSRGMGNISKEKIRAIKKRDGNEPVMLYKAGGRVKKFDNGGKIVGRMPDGKPVVVNPDGSISTHIMATGEFDGKGINYPTIYGGKKMSPKAAENLIKKNNFVDPDTGKKLREYPSGDEAEVDYMLRQHPQIDREASYIKDKAEGRYVKGGKVAGKNWIAGAIKKPGALRASLGVKGDKPIPAKKLAKAAKAPGKLGQRARLAETLKGFKK